jgi:SAM-dependent methyltransferase
MVNTTSRSATARYDANYGNFQTELYAEIRREAFGEDIGQNSWLTSDEQDKFLEWLDLTSRKILLDVACGAGGPALRITAATGCSVVGVDTHDQAIATACSLASQRGVSERAEFRAADATRPLPFSDASFDAITRIDAINHLPDRPRVIADWTRVLKPGGRLLFTDPITVTGALTNAETRYAVWAVYTYSFRRATMNSSLHSGLELLVCEDVTANMAKVAEARRKARAARSAALREIEGESEHENHQEFLAVATRVAGEGRLSRFLYVSKKPG